MKSIKVFPLTQEKKINEFFKENKDKMAGSSMNIFDDKIVFVVEEDKEKSDRIAMLQKTKAEYEAKILGDSFEKRWSTQQEIKLGGSDREPRFCENCRRNMTEKDEFKEKLGQRQKDLERETDQNEHTINCINEELNKLQNDG